MLFFRSEELVRAWCRAHDCQPGPTVTMRRLWGLALRWYSTRLDPESRRPQADEMRRIFAGLGLDGAFWDPLADTFG